MGGGCTVGVCVSMRGPTISVVVPTYNRKGIVIEAPQSILVQKPANYEVIVVDDGSTDRTVEYLRSLHLPIYIIQSNHRGAAASINKGIKRASGQYIAFLDSDDLWLQGILQAQLLYLTQHPDIPLVYTDQYIEVLGKRTHRTRFQCVDLSHEEKTKFRFPSFVQFVPIQISSVMVRRSIFDATGYFNERLAIHYDSELWNRICEKYPLGYVARPLFIRRCERDPQRLTNNNHRELYCEDGRKYIRMYEKRRRNTCIEEEKEAIRESYRRIDNIQTSSIPLHFHLREFQ